MISVKQLAAVRFSSSGAERSVSHHFGGHSERETPLPIPNRVVKPLCADGTWPERAWESRSPPFISRAAPRAARLVSGPFGARRRGLAVAGSAGGRLPPPLRRLHGMTVLLIVVVVVSSWSSCSSSAGSSTAAAQQTRDFEEHVRGRTRCSSRPARTTGLGRAADGGSRPRTLARGAARLRRQLHLVLVDDRPGVEEDRAHIWPWATTDSPRRAHPRRGGEWILERIE